MKNGRCVNVNIDMAAFDALERHCSESGQTKTVAIERALLKCYGAGGRRAPKGQCAAALLGKEAANGRRRQQGP